MLGQFHMLGVDSPRQLAQRPVQSCDLLLHIAKFGSGQGRVRG